MSNVFNPVWLVRRGEDLHWITHRVTFEPRPILAHIQLTALSMQNGERFQPFRRQFAKTYIETTKTPVGPWGPMANEETDNFVWMDNAGELTFVLKTEGIEGCSAFGLIHDRGGQKILSSVKKTLSLAVFDDDGTVVGRHIEEQLEGGEKLHPEDIQEQVLRRASAWTDRNVDVAQVDLTGLPPNADFRINTRTRRPVPPRDPGRTP